MATKKMPRKGIPNLKSTKDADEWFDNLPTPGGDEGPKAIYSRPSERVAPGSTEYLKLIPDPDPANNKPFLSVRAHYIDRKMYMCPGDACYRQAGMPCYRNRKIWDKIRGLHEKRWSDGKGNGLSEKEELFYQAERAEADKWKGDEYHFYYTVNVTPSVSNEDQVIDFKDCYGDRPNRSPQDKDCLACPWQTHCSEGLKIFQCRYNPKGRGMSNGEKMLDLFTSKKRLASLFAAGAKDGVVESRVVKVERAAGPARQAGYKFNVTDEEFKIPENVISVIADQLMPLKDAVIPYIKASREDILKAIEDAEFEIGVEADTNQKKLVESFKEAFEKEDDKKEEEEEISVSVDIDDDDSAEEEGEPDILEEHPISAVREMAKGKKKAKKADPEKPKCFGDYEVFARGEGPCRICEQRHPEIVDACEKKVQAMTDMMAEE